MSKRYIFFFFLLFLFVVQETEAQNKQTVEATINLEASSDLIKVAGIVLNTEEYSQSLRGVLSINFNTPENGVKPNRTVVENRFVINSLEKIIVAEASFLTDIKERIILLFLVYDNENKIVGNKKIILNENANQNTGTGLELQEQFLKEIAKTNKVSEEKNRDGISLTGLVFEDTRTKPGRDFYREFYSKYLSLNIDGPENVTIKEVLATGRNTRLDILVGDKLVWRFFARPQIDYLRTNADNAIRRVIQRFQQLKKNNVSTSN